MPLKNSYAIWNNKGGVGKSTITFHLASRYAELNPARKVLVIDLCPQANSSMMILGGGADGETRVLDFSMQNPPKSVVGYLSDVLSGGAKAGRPNPNSYVVQANQYNQHVPPNLFLLCGDGNLEPMAPAISQAATAPKLTPASNPWLWVHEVFKNLIVDITNSTVDEWLVLIDTNPSFSIYTELAVSSAERLIVPVNADDSSRVATNAMFILLHGMTPPHPIYGQWTYAANAQQNGLAVPRVHMIIGNRMTQYLGSAAAFSALSAATADTLFQNYQSHPHYFTVRSSAPHDLESFRSAYSIPLRDFNTAGVVSAHQGKIISGMAQGYYDVYGNNVKVSADQVKEARLAIDAVIATL